MSSFLGILSISLCSISLTVVGLRNRALLLNHSQVLGCVCALKSRQLLSGKDSLKFLELSILAEENEPSKQQRINKAPKKE